MANRFLNNITINDQYTFPSSDGTDGQILSTTGAADGTTELVFVDQNTINAGNAEHVVIYAKNTHTASIAKGTPVYITGTVGATDTVEIAPADASNSAKMPAVGLLDDTLAVNDFGYVITGGFMDNITTDPIDGSTPSSNDTVYVKAGGGLTLTKPTGASNLIQNVAKVGKVSGGNSGSLIVSSILRTNDVPNLSTGKIWVGDSNTIESTVVHLDETNNRLGVNQTSPIGAVHIVGPNTNPAMTTSALVVEQGDGAKILIDGNDIDAAAGMLYLNDYSTNDVVFGGQIRVGGGGSPVGNSWFANGNVGIGTTSPVAKLDVTGGDIRLSTNATYLRSKDSASAIPRVLGMNSANAFYVGPIDTYAGGPIVYGASSNLTYHGFYGGGSEKVRITSTGSVGIGTTSPGYKLDVNGSIRSGGNYLGNGSAYTYLSLANGNFHHKFYTKTNTTAALERFTIEGGAATPSAYFLNVNGVGIGTTSPTGLLTLESNNSSPYPRIDIKSTAYYPGSEIRFLSSAGTEVSSIESYNNPGIQHLKLQYNASSTGGKCELQDNAAILGAGTSGGQSYLSVGITDARIVTNYSTRMYFNTLGYVGVNETSPNARLQVKESSITTFTGTGSSAQLRLRGGYTTNEYIILGFSQDSNKDIGRMAVKRGSSGSSFHWGVSTNYGNGITNEAMILNHQGRLGINNLTPSYLLDVGGNGRVNGTLTCVTLVQTSQRDQKKDIADIDKTKAKAIPFKEYKYKSSIDGSERKRYGVVAEDIENDYPELVHTGADGVKGVNYIDLLVKRVAELEKELEDISLTPGPKGDKGDTGAQGPAGANGTNGKDGANGNDHLKNVQSISFNEKTGQLEITIEGYKDPFKFNPAK